MKIVWFSKIQDDGSYHLDLDVDAKSFLSWIDGFQNS